MNLSVQVAWLESGDRARRISDEQTFVYTPAP